MGEISPSHTADYLGNMGGGADHHPKSYGEHAMKLKSDVFPIILSACIGIALVMIGDRRDVVEMKFLSLFPTTLSPGAPAIITWETKVLRPGCDGEVTRQIIDSSRVVFTYAKNQSVINPDSTPKQFSGTFIVPNGVHTGAGIHRTTAVRWCNPLQKWLWPLHDPVRDVPIVIL
jgi:hypothetical protein